MFCTGFWLILPPARACGPTPAKNTRPQVSEVRRNQQGRREKKIYAAVSWPILRDEDLFALGRDPGCGFFAIVDSCTNFWVAK